MDTNKLIDFLNDIEWQYDGGFKEWRCVSCGVRIETPHSDNCELIQIRTELIEGLENES